MKPAAIARRVTDRREPTLPVVVKARCTRCKSDLEYEAPRTEWESNPVFTDDCEVCGAEIQIQFPDYTPG